MADIQFKSRRLQESRAQITYGPSTKEVCHDDLQHLKEQLSQAKAALARDSGAAVAARDWQRFLRDRYDVAALLDHIEVAAERPEFVKELHAAGDRARQAGSGRRGRPPRASKAVATAKSASTVGVAADVS